MILLGHLALTAGPRTGEVWKFFRDLSGRTYPKRMSGPNRDVPIWPPDRPTVAIVDDHDKGAK